MKKQPKEIKTIKKVVTNPATPKPTTIVKKISETKTKR